MGTNEWKRISPIQWSKKSKIVWLDMEQPRKQSAAAQGEQYGDDSSGEGRKDYWWPGFGRRWRLGLSCEDLTLEIGEPDVFKV